MSPQEGLPQYVFVLRDEPDAGSKLAAQFRAKVADARDFETFAPCVTDLGGDALLLHRLQMVIVSADPAEAAAIAKRESARVAHFGQGRKFPVAVAATIDAPETLNEPEVTWGLQATGVHRTSYTGRGVRVGVLDMELDDTQPDFANRPATTRTSFTSFPANRSGLGHGTPVCGIVAGPLVPFEGPRYGVAADCDLYFGRVGDEQNQFLETAVYAGINWALCMDCRVLNLSFGIEVDRCAPSNPCFDAAFASAERQGMLIVAAGGNGSHRDQGRIAPVEEPANSPSALAVGAIHPRRSISGFSPGGVNGGGGEVNLVAPGESIRSACGDRSANYTHVKFTSYSTPFVTGIAALWLEREPTLTVRELWRRLECTAIRLGDPLDFGAGLVQAP